MAGEATTGQEAFAIAQDLNPDLVLLTGFPGEAAQQAAFAAGAHRYLEKDTGPGEPQLVSFAHLVQH